MPASSHPHPPGPALPDHVLAAAERRCREAGERLTPARLNAYAELVAQKRAVSAYELLALLETREQRKLAPLTVYRQLDFLTRVGLVHRLASAQAYLACGHPDHPHESFYLVCLSCGGADELDSGDLGRLLGEAAASRGFRTRRRVVEVEGTCERCSHDERSRAVPSA